MNINNTDATALPDVIRPVINPIATTPDGKIKHHYYCEYIYCNTPNRTLVPFKTKNDWSLRMLHKKCCIDMSKCSTPNDELISTNTNNPVFSICKSFKNNGQPCSMKCDTEGFNKKFGYCKYHNHKKFHLQYN